MELSFDTTFLIDLHREIGNQESGPANRFLSKRLDAVLMLSAVALGEFAAGFADPVSPWLLEARRRFAILPVDQQVSMVYREVFRSLKQKGLDRLYRNCARSTSVTRNGKEFRRISALKVISY